MAVAIFVGVCTVSLAVALAITCAVVAGDQRIIERDERDEARQNLRGGHDSKHSYSALHMARERSYERSGLNGCAERHGRSSML